MQIADVIDWEFIKQFFSGDFFYWFYSALVQAFAAMIAVLGMFIVHSIQIRKQDKNEISEEAKSMAIKIYADILKKQHSPHSFSIITESKRDDLLLKPVENLKIFENDLLKDIRNSDISNTVKEDNKNILINIKKFNIYHSEINKKYKDTISEGRGILVFPFIAFLVSVVGLLLANVLKYYNTVGIIVTVLFTVFIIYMVWHIKRKSNYLIKTGSDYLSEEELTEQAQKEVETEINDIK